MMSARTCVHSARCFHKFSMRHCTEQKMAMLPSQAVLTWDTTPDATTALQARARLPKHAPTVRHQTRSRFAKGTWSVLDKTSTPLCV